MATLRKSELIDAIASDLGCKKYEAENFIESFIKVTCETMKIGNKLSIMGFLTFEPVEVKECERRNPRTGEIFTKPSYKKTKVSVGKILKDSPNQ